MEVVNDISDEAVEDSAEYDDIDKSSFHGKSHKQSYRKAWESDPDFKGWLKGVDGQPNRAFCTYCQVSLFAHRLSLLKHTCTLKHQRSAQKALLKSNGTTSGHQETVVVPSTSQPGIQHISSDNDKLNLCPVKTQQNLPSTMTVTIIQDGDFDSLELHSEQNIVDDNNALVMIADDEDLGLNTCVTRGVQEESQPKVEPHADNAMKMTSASNSGLSAHVLDTSKGQPAANVRVVLYKLTDSRWTHLGETFTDLNGRCSLKQQDFKCGRYKLHFDTGKYFELQHKQTMFPFVEIPFDVHSPSEHYHIPLILSLFGYSTYRGS